MTKENQTLDGPTIGFTKENQTLDGSTLGFTKENQTFDGSGGLWAPWGPGRRPLGSPPNPPYTGGGSVRTPPTPSKGMGGGVYYPEVRVKHARHVQHYAYLLVFPRTVFPPSRGIAILGWWVDTSGV